MTGATVFSKHETLEDAKKEMTNRRNDRDKDVDALMDQIDEVEFFYGSLRIVHEEED